MFSNRKFVMVEVQTIDIRGIFDSTGRNHWLQFMQSLSSHCTFVTIAGQVAYLGAGSRYDRHVRSDRCRELMDIWQSDTDIQSRVAFVIVFDWIIPAGGDPVGDMLPVFTLFSNTKHSFFHYLCMLMTLYHHIRYSHPSPNFQTPNHIYTKPAAFLPLRHPQVAQPSVFILQLSVPQSLRHSASETGHPGSCGGAENNEQSLSWIIAENNFEIQIALSTIQCMR